MTIDTKKTPYCSTGSVDTNQNTLRALVDWVSITFLEVQSWEKITRILSLPDSEFLVQNKGFNGYQNTAKYGNIMIAFNEHGSNSNMGVHLNMNGQACREFEHLFEKDVNWSLFFRLVMAENVNITRLDVAIDDFKGYFTIDQLYRTAKNGCMTAKRIKKARRFEEFFLQDGATCGQTFYVGKSDWVIRFYDKLEERKNKGKDVSVDFWNRYEIQLRSDVAFQAVDYLAYNEIELGNFVKGFLKDKIDFKIKNKKDSNRSRWKSKKWWLKFLGDIENISLTQQAPDMTIEKKYNWINKQVSKSLYMLTESFQDEDALIDFIKLKGKDNINKNDIRQIEEFKNSEVSLIVENEIKTFIKDRNLKNAKKNNSSNGEI